MPATFGVTTIPAVFTVPTGCVVKKLTDKESIETVKYRSAVGITIRNIPKKLKMREVTIDMVGIAPLSLVAAGDFSDGVLKVVRVRNQETNDDVPASTATLKAYSTFTQPEE